jgi:hypothetical protein
MTRLLKHWRKIVIAQLLIIGMLFTAIQMVHALSNKINDYANEYNTNYVSYTQKLQ